MENRRNPRHGVALDARNLHETGDGVAGHAQVLFHGGFGSMLDLALLPCSLSLLLLQKLTDKAVLTPEKFMEGAIEDETAIFEHEEGCVGVGLAVGVRNHAAMLG